MNYYLFLSCILMQSIVSMELPSVDNDRLIRCNNELSLHKKKRKLLKKEINTQIIQLLDTLKPNDALEQCKKYNQLNTYVAFCLAKQVAQLHPFPFYEVIWRANFKRSKKILRKFQETKSSYLASIDGSYQQQLMNGVARLGDKYVYEQYPGLLKFLLDNKICATTFDEEGKSCMAYAIGTNNIEAVKHLIPYLTPSVQLFSPDSGRSAVTPLLLAASLNKFEIAQELLSHNLYNFNDTTWHGDNALQCAVYSDSLEMVKLLLNYSNYPVDHKNHNDQTALEIARNKENVSIIGLLVAHNAH